jgi:hypothetical protein
MQHVRRRDAYEVLVGKAEDRRTLGRLRRRWDGNIDLDLREVRWGMNWINLAQNRDKWQALVYAAMNLRVL